ncbi:MAG: hypothetical protein COA84_14060 [Robiginitomaculum sp.]|nr:MAG: hypothetical protein COA84_14060 [Robiginitomaculum sp.]
MIKITQVTEASPQAIREVIAAISKKTLVSVNGFDFYPKQAHVDEHKQLYVEGFIKEPKNECN